MKKEINGRRYVFAPMGASKEALDLYLKMQALLMPLVGAVADSAIVPLIASGQLDDEFKAGGGGLKGAVAVAPRLLGAASEHATFSKIGTALGGLAGNSGFRDLVMRLFKAGVSIEIDVQQPSGDIVTRQQALGDLAADHFGAHLGDFIPCAYWALIVNYKGAFTEAFGGLLTQSKGALGAVDASA